VAHFSVCALALNIIIIKVNFDPSYVYESNLQGSLMTLAPLAFAHKKIFANP